MHHFISLCANVFVQRPHHQLVELCMWCPWHWMPYNLSNEIPACRVVLPCANKLLTPLPFRWEQRTDSRTGNVGLPFSSLLSLSLSFPQPHLSSILSYFHLSSRWLLFYQLTSRWWPFLTTPPQLRIGSDQQPTREREREKRSSVLLLAVKTLP